MSTHGRITVISISDSTGTTAPSAGANGELGRLALESDTIGTVKYINSISPSASNIILDIEGYYPVQINGNTLKFNKIINLTVSLSIIGGTGEIGQYISPTLNWSYNNGNVDPNVSQSINQGIGSLATNIRSYGPLTSTNIATTYTITGIDSVKGTATSSASTSFYHRTYHGTSTLLELTETEIKSGPGALSRTVSDNASNRSFDYTFDCSGGKYFFYAYPADWGLLNLVSTKVNGLSFSSWSDLPGTTEQAAPFNITITNAYGHSESYYVYKCFNLQNGSTIPAQFRP